MLERLVALMKALRSAVDARDLLLGAGLLLLSIGCGQIWAPLMLAVPGGILVYVALFYNASE